MTDPTTPRRTTRRAVLLGGASALGVAAFSGSALTNALATPGAGLGRRLADPFTLGVASGEPLADGVVLWTRLATDPTAEDGRGGMPEKALPVRWEVAEDENFSKIVTKGETSASPELAHSVHVEVEGLRAGAEYFYRFNYDGNISPVGRTRTAPAAGAVDALTMCFASCAHYGEGYFTAYRRMAEDEPGLILHLGDYQYEYEHDPDADVREVLGPETKTLANYRQRHAQYKTDADLQAAHAVAPWVVVFDDHELDNNWADEIPEKQDGDFLARREAAFQAYYENMPLRARSKPNGIDLQLYRRIQWGGLANFHMLDTRQYRDDQPCGDESGDCAERLNPERSITGTEQEKWILDGFNSSSARWDVLGQQVFFSRLDGKEGDGVSFSSDSWAAYVANRDRIAAGFAESKVRNGVVFTGDVHKHWAAEVQAKHEDTDSATVATEFVTTSITSGGDGDPNDDGGGALDENPHVKYYTNMRGYVRATFDESRLKVDYRTLDYVREKGASASTAASFVVEDGTPKINPA